MQLHQRLISPLRRARRDVATLLDKEAINAACREENYSWKERLFTPANTVHLFILQILNRNTALNDTLSGNFMRPLRYIEDCRRS